MNNTEAEVHLSDLLAMLLKAIRVILCLVLMLGFLGGVYGAYSVIRAQPRITQEDVETAEMDVAKAESDLAKAQKAVSFRDEVKIPGALQKAKHAEQMIIESQEYMRNSIYFGMNPFHRGAARLRFTVDVAPTIDLNKSGLDDSSRSEIVIAYTQMCPFDTPILEQIQAIMGIETQLQYIEELITVASDDNHQIVEICVYYDDLSLAEQIIDYLYQVMTSQAEKNLPAHLTKVLSTFTGYEVDQSMSERHAEAERVLLRAELSFQKANESIQALQNDASDEQQAVEDASNALRAAQKALQNAQINHAKNRPSLRSMAKRAIKYGVLGGLIGIVLGCCYAWCKGLFSGIVQNQNEVIHRYSFPLIGVLPRSKKVWFDKTIQKLEGDPTGDFEAVAHATVQSLISRISDQSVCLISSCCKSTAERLAASTGNKVQVIGNIIDNADAVKELANYEGIVLVEERGKSRINLVDAEVLRAKALSKEILGIVLA